MAFRENLNEFLDTEQGYAIRARVVPAEGEEYSAAGIFNHTSRDVDLSLGSGSKIIGQIAQFETAESNLANIKYNDVLIIENITYRVRGLQADGTGWLTIILEKQS